MLKVTIKQNQPQSNYSTWRKQQYGLYLQKFVHTNLPWAGFVFRSMELQADVLPIEPPLPVWLETSGN